MPHRKYSLFTFNRLSDRPSPLLPPSENTTLMDLERAFPFIFKPSRVFALHDGPEPITGREDHGHPSEDGLDRWLIRLRSDFPGVPLCLFAISPENRLTLWRYQPEQGLFRVHWRNAEPPRQQDKPVLPGTLAWPSQDIPLILPRESTMQPVAAQSEFQIPRLRLLKVEQSTDADGWHHLRVETRLGRHFIQLDLAALRDQNCDCVRYYRQGYRYIPGEHDPACQLSATPCAQRADTPSASTVQECPVYRQIGGFGAGEVPLFWCEEHKILRTTHKGQEHWRSSEVKFQAPFRLLAALQVTEQVIVAGGVENYLVYFTIPHTHFNEVIQSYRTQAMPGYGQLYSLALLPRPGARAWGRATALPWILAGSNDQSLYIWQYQPQSDSPITPLEKVIFHGRVESIQVVNAQPQWADVVVSIQTRGLYCGRLFFDQIPGTDLRPRWDTAKRQFFAQLAHCQNFDPSGLRALLANTRSIARQQIGLAYVAYHLDENSKNLFSEHMLRGLHEHALNYLGHALKRRALACLEGGSECPQALLEHIIALLREFACGPYLARMMVRDLEGLLSILAQQHESMPSGLDDLLRELPDAKRLLHKLAHEIETLSADAGQENELESLLGIFASTCERLRYERAFREVTLMPQTHAAPVTAMAIVGALGQSTEPNKKTPHFVWVNSNENRIHGYANDPSDAKVRPMHDDTQWAQHLFAENAGIKEQWDCLPAHCLLALDDDTLLIAAGKLGLIRRGEQAVRWQHKVKIQGDIHALARHPSQPDWLVAGGEWQPGRPLLYSLRVIEHAYGPALSLDGGEFTAVHADFRLPFTITGLAWDDEQNLWGVTSGQHYLLRWRKPHGTPPLATDIVKYLPGSQYALAHNNGLLVCGGQEGIVRAFRNDGALAWSFLVKGAVRAIQAMAKESTPECGVAQDNAQDQPKSAPPRLAVISEGEHVWTLTAQGQQYNLFHLPNHHPIALASRQISQHGAMHHLVGTMEGTVFLVEMICPPTVKVDQFDCLDYLTKTLDGAHQNWPRLRQAVGKLRTSVAQLQAWCRIEAIQEEPLRAAWAVRHLVERHQQYEFALEVLAILPDHGASPAMHKFHIHVVNTLGRKFTELPAEQQTQLVALAEHMHDGVLASLLHALPPQQAAYPGQFHGSMFKMLRKKLLENKTFTSSALLQFLQQPPADWLLAFYFLWLLNTHEKNPHNLDKLAWGFVEGVLHQLGQRLDIDKGLLLALARVDTVFPRLYKKLRHRPVALQRWLAWMEDYAEVWFAQPVQHAWQALFPILRGQEKNWDVEDVLRTLRTAQQHQLTPQDQSAFAVVIALFPQSAEPLPVWQPIAMAGELPDGWKQAYALSQRLHHERQAMQRQLSSAPEIFRALNQLHDELEKYKPQSLLLGNLLKFWREAWLAEIAVLRQAYLPQDETNYLRLAYTPDLLYVDGEPIPLTVELYNHGPQTVANVVLWLEQPKSWVIPTEPHEARAEELACQSEYRTAGNLVLHTKLLPMRLVPDRVEIPVAWQVGNGEKRHETLKLQPRQRHSDYAWRYPRQDELAYQLFSATGTTGQTTTYNGSVPARYGRIVLRIWRDQQPSFKVSELRALVQEWAQRAGRAQALRWFTLEAQWANAGIVQVDRQAWREALARAPQGLEIWLMADSVPWNREFLAHLDQAPSTALLLPQLTIADGPADYCQPAMRELLHELLNLAEPSGLRALQWALKACCQGIQEVAAQDARTAPSLLLARNTPHGSRRMLRRGEWPDDKTWRDPQHGHWLVCGADASGVEPEAVALHGLPPDPALPLAALVPRAAFRALWRMGLIRLWQKRYWVPRGSALLNYVDDLFPTRAAATAQGKAQADLGWVWDTQGWARTEALARARNALFSHPSHSPPRPPHEGLDIADWQRLQPLAGTPTDSFCALLGLPGRAAYQDIGHNLQTWQQILAGHFGFQSQLVNYLRGHGIQAELLDCPALAQSCAVAVLTLPLAYAGSGFYRLWLVMPSATTRQQWQALEPRDQPAALAQLLRQVRQHAEPLRPDWRKAIALVLYDLPSTLWRAGELYAHSAVFLAERAFVRLMSSRRDLAQVLLELVQAQTPLTELARNHFQTNGPVSGPMFFGRSAALRELAAGLRARQSYVITGPRGIGKSSLLRQLQHTELWRLQLADQFYPVFVDLQAQRYGLNYGGLARGILAADPALSWPEHFIQQAEQVEQLFLDASQVPLSVTQAALRLLEEMLAELGKQLQPRIPVLLFDEADGLYQFDLALGEPVFTLFRAIHNQKRAHFLFAVYPAQAVHMATGVASMMDATQNAQRQSYNFLESLVLAELAENEGGDLVDTGLRRLGLRPTEPQARALTRACFAIPSLLQWTCLEVCRALDTQLAAGGSNDLNPVVIDQALAAARKGFLDRELLQLPDALRFTLLGLMVDKKFAFSVEDACVAAKDYARVDWSAAQARQELRKLLYTLWLSRTGQSNDYRFSGPKDQPYLPTLCGWVYGQDGLENMLLQDT